MILADAQVHATLAFAAAAAPGSSQEWNDIRAAEITPVPPAPALSKLTPARPRVPDPGG
jgi:hypothetical protein